MSNESLDEVLARFAANQPELHGTKLIIEVDVADVDPRVTDPHSPAGLLVDCYEVDRRASREYPPLPWGKITLINANWKEDDAQ